MIHPSHQPEARRSVVVVALLALVTLGVGFMPRLPEYDIGHYLVLHTVLEMTAVVVASLVFAVVWSSRREHPTDNLIILATAFLGVAILDFSHAMSVQGMPAMITASSPEKGIDFWLAARAVGAIAWLIAAWLPSRRNLLPWSPGVQVGIVLAVVAVVEVVVLGYPQWLPRTYVQGVGLTHFKVFFEYGLAAAFAVVAARLFWLMREAREFDAPRLFAAAAIMAESEIYFTLYVGVSDGFNLLGHIFKIIGYLYLYRAVFMGSVQRPYSLLRDSQRRLSATLDALPDLLFEMDVQGHYLEVHSSRLQDLSAPIRQLLGNKAADVMPAQDAAIVLAALQEAQAQGWSRGKTIELDIHNLGKRWFELSVAPKPVDPGADPRFVLISRDITDRFEKERALYTLSHFDPLTGLPNRTFLLKSLKEMIARGGFIAVFWVDLDRFKDINDTLGHAAGDGLLLEMAQRLKRPLREQDTLARHSGDTFVVVAPSLTRAESAALAAQLIQVAADPVTIFGQEISVTVSVGVTLYPDDAQEATDLLQSAEAAMYRVKDEGRNHYDFYLSEVQTRVTRAAAVGSALKLALQRKELRLVYQPQVSLDESRIIGVEALLRWQSPQFGAVSPCEFIPLAEANGLIVSVGEWVIREALTQLRSWLDAGLPPMIMAINLSATQFIRAGFIAQALSILESTGAPAECVEFEITEAVAMRAPEAAVGMIQKLGEHGIRFAMDDFGTGYSSLSYLKRFRIGKLKIDQSFVRDIFIDPDDQSITVAIIEMARSLGITTIAEGVETPEQLQFLYDRGCQEAQGYLYSHPLPPDELARFVRAWQPAAADSMV